ncbi:MAG: hypothetical protein CO186_05600 [Zetaproteobacteria bacterium CG_4_9_14_3_um_filter_49_83]|nr:MAG: hypothetical protein AUJ56_01230 [Zetaproteobacteria bacterium CG1_02_49_23]PIQ33828.1 MAG: hypothetical protein COW62_04105 [Zetaproteobacteria bacterium CG17_big_fil_post_rev_8_21_14_2_50_50_13]PIV30340.1 MAG: hypothetical protein COS35_07160 [Zetaproteobacteria bacterium CG02_land_8_20_14_3_00_50_9]PIY55580.1 MAG: hypothetical protein COZ00_08670 [Zetaproteobacteria bacterium CG_4_10_14_0_8_um_filter_49_80]PJA35472.1 MAG: hypothetical protein CO186_05600 [Zetaproteobacteria bacterium
MKSNQILLVKAKGGMGNRMLCAVTGIAYGLLSRRQVVIDWTDQAYSKHGENVFLSYFNTPLVEVSGNLPSDGGVFPKIWQGHLDWSVSRMVHAYDPDKHSSFRIHRKYSANLRRLDYPEDIIVLWSYTHRIQDLQSALSKQFELGRDARVDDILRHLLTHYMVLRPEIKARIDAFRNENFSGNVIGVHVRHSDRSANVDRYLDRVKRLCKNNDDVTIFVATDNQSVLSRFQAGFPKVISTDKWYPDSGVPMHQNSTCPNAFENGVEALVDMYLLSYCHWLVYPKGSTFSYISSILSSAPKENIIDMDGYNFRVHIARILRDILH